MFDITQIYHLSGKTRVSYHIANKNSIVHYILKQQTKQINLFDAFLFSIKSF
jgi:hypothetical protein